MPLLVVVAEGEIPEGILSRLADGLHIICFVEKEGESHADMTLNIR